MGELILMSPDPTPTWDQVLADCEAAAAHAEALMKGRGPVFAPPPATLDQLPAGLPRPTEEQLERARAIHERNLRLQSALVTAMRETKQQIELHDNNRRARFTKPLYIDRQL